ncbi:MAG TPA: type II toxin-antitoxin system VapC family toxin [Pyrinomonadaceae bacterium]|nr:type II toxin-antitoxin system VapC family toxin [Pyrinomonadaceae bacterium]
MSSFVIDSSAILAVLNQESGAENAIKYFAGGLVSSVNLAEVLSKSVERGSSVKMAMLMFDLLQLEVVDLEIEHAIKAAELRPLTKHLGLSLGDRCCLALAMLRETTAVSADKDWKKLKFCKVEVTR